MMRYRRLLSVSVVAIALVGLTVVTAGQGRGGPPRDPAAMQPRPAGNGSISGVVLVADTGHPARRARVMLSGGEPRGNRNTTTDDHGRFLFSGLPAGRFSLRASKPGHITAAYGQRRPGSGQAGTPIVLTENGRLEVQIQMPRGGVITGTVLDEQGEAIPGTPIRVMRFALQNGERTLQPSGTGSTDDRGIYRIYGLQPGEYVVSAAPRNVVAARAMERVEAELQAVQQPGAGPGTFDLARVREMMVQRMSPLAGVADSAGDAGAAGYAPVFYPGTTSPGGAATVTLGVGEEKTGIDFQLQLVPVARVEGLVVSGSGPVPQNVQVILVNVGTGIPGLPNSTTRPDAEGQFRLTNVAPGQYLLIARGTIGDAGRGERGVRAGPAFFQGQGRGRGMAGSDSSVTRLWATAEVLVDGRDVSNLVLTLQPGMTISGRIAFDAATLQPPTELTRIRVTAVPIAASEAERQLSGNVNANVDTSGRFTISGVLPGRYRITAAGAGSGWMVGTSIAGGQDTLDFPIEVKPGGSIGNVVLTLTDRVTELSGVIVNDRNQPAPDYTIVVYPADRTFWMPQSRRIASTRPATDGRFTFRRLPAGDYRIVPVLDPEPGSWFDPAWLQQLDATALRLSLHEGEQKVQNLRLGPGGI